MLQLHLSYQQFYCLLRCDLYKRFYGTWLRCWYHSIYGWCRRCCRMPGFSFSDTTSALGGSPCGLPQDRGHGDLYTHTKNSTIENFIGFDTVLKLVEAWKLVKSCGNSVECHKKLSRPGQFHKNVLIKYKENTKSGFTGKCRNFRSVRDRQTNGHMSYAHPPPPNSTSGEQKKLRH